MAPGENVGRKRVMTLGNIAHVNCQEGDEIIVHGAKAIGGCLLVFFSKLFIFQSIDRRNLI